MITLLFATYNGEDTLPRMLEELCNINPPELGWKIVIVDNASTDCSAEIIKSFQDRLPITYLYEPRKGKNNALNKGLDYIEGDKVILTDDDIIPTTSWLLELIDCAEKNPTFDIFAGKIIPHWPVEHPPKYLESIPLSVAFALTDPMMSTGEISAGQVFGPNMMVRTKLFETGARFDSNIGPNRQNYAMGSETEFTQRMASTLGARCFFCSTAVVKHIIHESQLSPSWLSGRAFRSGRGNAIREMDTDSKGMSLFGIPIWTYSLLLKKSLLAMIESINLSRNHCLTETWKYNFYKGYVYQKIASLKIKNKS